MSVLPVGVSMGLRFGNSGSLGLSLSLATVSTVAIAAIAPVATISTVGLSLSLGNSDGSAEHNNNGLEI